MLDPIHRRGAEWIEKLTPNLPHIFKASYWEDHLIQSLFASHDFQNQLFRFVDVYPSLKSTESIADHFQAYLENLDLAPAVQDLLKLATSPLTKSVSSRLIKYSVEKMARKYIFAETLFSNPKVLKEMQAQGYGMSFDVLGEATLTELEATNYQQLYLDMIEQSDALGVQQLNLSIKASALVPHLRGLNHDMEVERLCEALMPIMKLAVQKSVFINIDMEQVDFHELIYAAFKQCLLHPDLKSYAGFGIVIQAYTKDSETRCRDLIQFSETRGVPFAIRLVKGAYWDYECAMARQRGWEIPVFTKKNDSDRQFEHLTTLLLEHHEQIFTAFATHNLRSMIHVVNVAENLGLSPKDFEFQMLYGMAPIFGEFLLSEGYACRLYCPIGKMIPGMGYLVRRLLENSSNTGFLQKFHSGVDLEELLELNDEEEKLIADRHTYDKTPLLNFTCHAVRESYEHALSHWVESLPLDLVTEQNDLLEGGPVEVVSPNNTSQILGRVPFLDEGQVLEQIAQLQEAFENGKGQSLKERVSVIETCADLMEEKRYELAALMTLEVGKNWEEADGDVVEAIDFCRFYARRAMVELANQEVISVLGEANVLKYMPRGVSAIISPWNFPLAILCGMSSASYLAGNPILLKPAEQSSLIAYEYYKILLKAGVSKDHVRFCPCDGEQVFSKVCSDKRLKLLAFTGSKRVGLGLTQKSWTRAEDTGDIPMVFAEMGGKNTAIVDEDTDLDEAIPYILHSAFGFAGQKCSALSRLLVHREVKADLLKRLVASIPNYKICSGVEKACDVGPLIDVDSFERVKGLLEKAEQDGQITTHYKSKEVPGQGYYVPLCLFEVSDIHHAFMQEEFFAPILTLMEVESFEDGIQKLNNSKYGLTATVFSRHPKHIDLAKEKCEVGNLYINRGCTGAIVGRQPFGGFKLSGTGSKAGGVGYLQQFAKAMTVTENTCRHGFVSHES